MEGIDTGEVHVWETKKKKGKSLYLLLIFSANLKLLSKVKSINK